MKIVWEDIDIKPGQRLQKPDCGRTGQYIVGYYYNVDLHNCPAVYGLVSLADGMFTRFGDGSPAELAKHMNEVGYYMPAELLQVYSLSVPAR